MVSFLAFSGALPLIAVVQSNWGFDGLFYVLMVCTITILVGSRILYWLKNRKLPDCGRIKSILFDTSNYNLKKDQTLFIAFIETRIESDFDTTKNSSAIICF